MNSIKEINNIVIDLKNKKTAKPVTIRTFLSWFGVQRRTSANVEYINEELNKVGIRTVPDYLDIWVDTPIAFELTTNKNTSENKDRTENFVLADVVGLNTPEDSKSADDPSFRIGKILLGRNAPVISVKPNASLSEAITLMIAMNFSQLPVMTTDRGQRNNKLGIYWQKENKKYVGKRSTALYG